MGSEICVEALSYLVDQLIIAGLLLYLAARSAKKFLESRNRLRQFPKEGDPKKVGRHE